jgi:RHH-type proline utilization regulon transcriptional repressor/proline dehydrogenase/delta 1-pyrroline-5-carboxylate dehydrogenase
MLLVREEAVSSPDRLEARTRAIGRELAELLPAPGHGPAAVAERRIMERMVGDPALRTALFRFVDVRPACRSNAELVSHLEELLLEADDSPVARRVTRTLRLPPARPVAAATAALGVRRVARRFIVGTDATAALESIGRLWRRGVATTLDLLGETTVTEAEADRYAAHCEETLRTLSHAAKRWPANSRLEADPVGPLPRVNLSVKVSALTSELRPLAPRRGADGARERLRHLLRVARDLDAHLHVDMESFDTRESVLDATLGLLAESEFRAGPSAGVVLQAYLVDSPDHLATLLGWAQEVQRDPPLTVRLVKGAYWDQEVVEAEQAGWPPPVFTDRRECDRNFEQLARTLIDAFPSLRPAIASHNLRSLSAAAAYAELSGAAQGTVEFQVLRGLGDETAVALAAAGDRVRSYSPIGDLVAGMAYLVRRLLENTSNDSFLVAQHRGQDIESLLEAP